MFSDQNIIIPCLKYCLLIYGVYTIQVSLLYNSQVKKKMTITKFM